MKYPNRKDIVEYNKIVLDIARVKKGDSHKVLSSRNIDRAVSSSKKARGDVEYKAAVLLKKLSQSHPFASGNRRTAYFSANKMIGMNKNYMLAKRREKQVELQRKIRQQEINNKGIAQWLRE